MTTTQPTLVCIPGLLCDHASWEPLLDALDRDWNLVIPAQDAFDSLIEMANHALGLFDGQAIVLGHSMGARVALELYRLAPERVAALGLFDTGVSPTTEAELPKRQARVQLAYDEGMEALCQDWLPPMIAPIHQANQTLMMMLHDMVLRRTPESHARQIHALIHRPDPSDLLPTIQCPTLVLVGREDRWSPVEQHAAIAAQIPGSRLAVIEQAGHFAPAEQPHRCADVILNWLRDAELLSN
jgi:pimeloyl-ACP methyl ester carboxylesterase